MTASSSAFATTANAPMTTAANSHRKTAMLVAGLGPGDSSWCSKSRKIPAVPKTKKNVSPARTTDAAGLAAERGEVMGRGEIEGVAREPEYPIFVESGWASAHAQPNGNLADVAAL